MRVLFVEDDPMNRLVVRDMLRVASVEMDEADSAEAGLRKLADESYDLILMDLRMPGMDGLTAIGHIRALADEKAQTPVVVVTADSGLDLQERCLAAGADAVVMKPVAMNALFDTIGRLMAERAPSEALFA